MRICTCLDDGMGGRLISFSCPIHHPSIKAQASDLLLRTQIHSDPTAFCAYVFVFTERRGPGLLHEGSLIVQPGDDESLSDAVVRTLCADGVDIQTGDILVFPRAASGHRTVVV